MSANLIPDPTSGPQTAGNGDASAAHPDEPTTLRAAPRYLWLVFVSAFLGWMFDAMDMSLFTLILAPSVAETAGTTDTAQVASIGGIILAVKLVAWGLGGVAFGFFADRFGRARTMVLTVAIYSIFTAASAFAVSWQQLAAFQAIAGLGIGGEWSAGAALIAETWPDRLRSKIMQLMQMAFAFGFLAAAAINLVVGPYGWRWVFIAGLVPVVLSIVIRKFVKEPERWVQARAAANTAPRATTSPSHSTNVPRHARLFGPELRRLTIVGILISLAMMVGSWGGLTWIPSWVGQMTAAEGGGNPSSQISLTFIVMMLGAIVGYLALIWMVDAFGRRLSYFIYCAGSLAASLFLFLTVDSVSGVIAFAPIYGFFVIGGFGTFALYLPELFPTIVRASAQGLSWNSARIVTGFGVLAAGTLVGFLGGFPQAAAAVSVVFVVGLVAIWFGPETKGSELSDF